jgi:hypothetical protein
MWTAISTSLRFSCGEREECIAIPYFRPPFGKRKILSAFKRVGEKKMTTGMAR